MNLQSFHLNLSNQGTFLVLEVINCNSSQELVAVPEFVLSLSKLHKDQGFKGFRLDKHLNEEYSITSDNR